MNITLTSPLSSTKIKEKMEQIESKISLLHKVGAQPGTIKGYSINLGKLADYYKHINVYNDIRYRRNWPDEILVHHYQTVTVRESVLFDMTNQMTLFEYQSRKAEMEEFDMLLIVIEKMEDEMQRRAIDPGRGWPDIDELCESVYTTLGYPTTVANSRR